MTHNEDKLSTYCTIRIMVSVAIDTPTAIWSPEVSNCQIWSHSTTLLVQFYAILLIIKLQLPIKCSYL